MTTFYYPGCSLHATAREYDSSARAVLTALGAPVVELPDWTCCGATSGHSVDHWLSLALPARNLLRAMAVDDEPETTVVAPCAACFNRLARAKIALDDPEFRRELERTLDLAPSGSVAVQSLVEYIVQMNPVTSRSLAGLSVACYYGCLLVRPPAVTGSRYHEQPRELDRLVEQAGARAVQWSARTDCCGANLGLIDSGPVQDLVAGIIGAARDAGADAVVTACPLCQANLEMRAEPGQELPVLYFTELLSLSLGLDCSRLWPGHLIDPLPLLKRLNLG